MKTTIPLVLVLLLLVACGPSENVEPGLVEGSREEPPGELSALDDVSDRARARLRVGTEQSLDGRRDAHRRVRRVLEDRNRRHVDR